MAKQTPVTPTDPTQSFTSFTNSAGQSFLIHGLSPMLPEQITNTVKAEWAKAGKSLPVIPTYTVPATDVHDEEVHEHTEKSILEGTPEEVAANKVAWEGYNKVNNAFQGEYSTRLMKKIFMAVATPPTDAWRAEMEFIGIALEPKGTPQERYQFVQLEVIQSMDDVAMLQVAVMRLAGIIDEAAVDAAKASFRSFVKQAVFEAAGTKPSDGNMEGQPVL